MNLNCVLFNCQGLATKRLNKLNNSDFQNIFKLNDIVLLTETWTDKSSCIEVNNFEVYPLHRQERKKASKRNSGGIILYIRNKYVSKDNLIFTSQDDILWVKISKSVLSSNKDLYNCLCYVVPDDSSRQSLNESNIFDRLLESVVFVEDKSANNCNLLICGDFNARSSICPDFVSGDECTHMNVLPEDYTPDQYMHRYSQDEGHTNNNGLLLLDFCKQTGVRILNGRVGNDKGIGRYTFVGNRGSSVVDYVLASQELFTCIRHFEVQDPNIFSDHCIINFSIEFGNRAKENNQPDICDYVSGKYTWKNDFKNDFVERLCSTNATEKLNLLNVNIAACSDDHEIQSCVTGLVGIVEQAAEPLFKKFVQPKNDAENENEMFAGHHENAWFNEECHQHKYYFLSMLDKYRQSNTDENRINMVKARSRYKKLIRKRKYEYDRDKTNTFINAKNKNAKLYWNMLKEAANVKPANIPLSSFEEYFKAVNNPSDPYYAPDEDVIFFNERYVNDEFCIMFEELNSNFSHVDILKAIKQLKTNKSGGPDKLINEMFIHSKNVLVPTLCNLFNKIFEIGKFPDDWSEGYVIPLHKKGNANEVENYRGITLLSSLGKLFTRVINNRLNEWAENYSVLIEAQAGFRIHMSTVDNIFVLHGLISHILNQGKRLFCAFIDFTKAFDYIVRDNLWYKLIKVGLRGKILNIIKSMYTSVKSRIKYCNKLGNEFYCNLGVRQGECLSPLLFSLFLNDLEEQFISSGLEGLDIDMCKMFLLLYADDIIIFANSAVELQEGLDLLSDYCKRWKLKINVSKTKIMIFRKSGQLPRNMAFVYDNEPLEIVSTMRYLGIVFTPGGSFSEAQNTLAGQAQKAIFKMNKYLHKFTFLTPKHKLELFDKLITPILNYGCQVWGFIQANAIERVHIQFCKRLLGVKKMTQNDFIYGELGRTNCITKRYILIIKYWFKILDVKRTKYIKIVYNMMLHDMDQAANSVNWASLVRHLLLSLGFYEVWLNQGVGN